MNHLNRVQQRIDNIDGLLISDIGNVRWISGFSGSSGWVICTPDDAVFITDSRYDIQAHEQVKTIPVTIYSSPTKPIEVIAQHLSRLGIKRLGIEATVVTMAVLEDWQKAFSGIDLVPVKGVIEPVRMVKSPEEVALIKRACGLTDACYEHVLRMIQPGVSEWDLMLEIEFYVRRSGAQNAFPPIAVSGPNSARPHGTATERKFENGDFVTMDFGAKLDGYCADLTRTVVVGEATPRHVEIYEQVLKANVECINFMKPGIPCRDVDALARRILDEKGLAQYFGHGLGHGLGRDVHDYGSLSARSEDNLEPGQVWTVEPGVYIEGFGGVRVEDDVVVIENGVEVLTHCNKSLTVLPR